MAKKPITYWRAREVQEIAESLIAEFHPHIADLTVLYVFRSEHSEENCRVVLGKARRVGGLNAYLAFRQMVEDRELNSRVAALGGDDQPEPREPVSAFYVIEIAFDTWQALTGPQRIALVDHELSHIGPAGMQTHDVEEFRGVIERHGLWRPALEEFIEASKQVPLFDNPAERLARNPRIREAAEALIPKKGSGIDSLTITVDGHDPLTLRADH